MDDNDIIGGGVSPMITDDNEGGVKMGRKSDNVIFGWPLRLP